MKYFQLENIPNDDCGYLFRSLKTFCATIENEIFDD